MISETRWLFELKYFFPITVSRLVWTQLRQIWTSTEKSLRRVPLLAVIKTSRSCQVYWSRWRRLYKVRGCRHQSRSYLLFRKFMQQSMFYMFTKRILIHLLLFVFSEIEMVYFTCDACGEQLKKPSVEKHYTQKCRDCYKLTCIDCLKVWLTKLVYCKQITNCSIIGLFWRWIQSS